MGSVCVMPKSITFAQFHEAAGSAVSAWGGVEDALCDLFTRLVVCSVTGRGIVNYLGNADGMWVVGGIFYGTTNLKARVEMIDRIIQRLVHDGDLKAEWIKIKDHSRTLYGRRNILAHGQVWGNDTKGASVVAYSIFDESRRVHMSYQQACAATPSFAQYRERITNLAIAINAHLAERGVHQLTDEPLGR